MHGVIRPLAVFALSSVFSVGVFHLVSGGEPIGSAPMEAAAANAPGGYQLARLRLLRQTLSHVSESYVDQGRVSPSKMFDSALAAAERLVPEAMFHRDGGTLAVHVADFRTVFEVPPIDSLEVLEQQLRRVAGVMQTYLDGADIPGDEVDFDRISLIEYAMVNGALETLDPHSVLLPPEQSREMDVENRGEFGGLGITIVIRDGKLTVDYPLPDTPAYRAGLQANDHIMRIDGESTINMSLEDAVDLLRGPPGADVTVEIGRENLREPLKVTLIREKIKLNPVEAYALGGGYGYVSIRTFHASVAADLREHLRRLSREEGGLRGLVLDLRDNPGGFLNQAIAVADTFLREGEIVSTRGPNDRRAKAEVAGAPGTEDMYPIVVLINANSASASEIVAGALRNNDRAVIVGERSFGKGSVQNLHTTSYDSKLKITIAQYLTPGERSIQSVGIPADIALVPTIVDERDVDNGDDEPLVLVYARERVRREADLDEHLERSSWRQEEATYSLRYRQQPEARRRRYDAPDLATDFETRFGLELLQIAPSWRRGEILESASRLVDKRARDAEQELVKAFSEIGIDWRAGKARSEASLKVRLDLGKDGQLDAGGEEVVTVHVTNTGNQSLYRLVGIADDNEILAGREFVFGHLSPGESRSFPQRVRLQDGYPTEDAGVTFRFRDVGGTEIASETAQLKVKGKDLPKLAWSWAVSAEDGDIAIGDRVRVELTVQNRGTGDSPSAVARLKNRAGRAIDMVSGTLEIGDMLAKDGSACAVTEPGIEAGAIVGDAKPDDERIVERRPPEYAEGCERVLAAGDTWKGAFELDVKEAREGGFNLDLSVGDAEAFDYASIVRGGFYGYYRQDDEIEFDLGPAPKSAALREPPTVRITVAPEARVAGDLVTVSGVVTDDSGVSNVLIYAADDKVFFQGSRRGEEVKSVPFSADVRLEPGPNTLIVLAADADGFTSTASRVVYLEGDAKQARNGDANEEDAGH